MNWKAEPLVSYRVIVDLIAATITKTGLTVRCELDSTHYTKGIVVSDAEVDSLISLGTCSTGNGTIRSTQHTTTQQTLRQSKQLSSDEP